MPYPSDLGGFVTNDDHPKQVRASVTKEALERIRYVAECWRERYMEQCWIQDDNDGFTGWRWEKYGTRLNIVCAANRYKDIIVSGPRHYSNNMRLAIDALGGIELLHAYAGDDYEQGFIDQYGTFHNRKEAMVLAKASGQIMYTAGLSTDELFSEHLV